MFLDTPTGEDRVSATAHMKDSSTDSTLNCEVCSGSRSAQTRNQWFQAKLRRCQQPLMYDC